jgi:L,D-transpeptidase catalytic domain
VTRIRPATLVVALALGLGVVVAVVALDRSPGTARRPAHTPPAIDRSPGTARRPGRATPETSFAAAAQALPRPAAPAFRPHRPVLLARGETRARFAPVEARVAARSAPDAGAAPVGHLERETSDGTVNIVLVVGEARRLGRLWVRVRLAELPNGRLGWVPRRALGGYGFVHTHLVVDRSRLRAMLLYDGRPIFDAPVGIGRPEAPTPAGEFYVLDRLTGFGDPFYVLVAFGTSARSTTLTDWPGGGVVGIHGTNEPGLIPGRISHGCIRMRNDDVLRLSRLMPVGTPLTIR